MGFIDKLRALVSDPDNQRKAKEFAQRQAEKRGLGGDVPRRRGSSGSRHEYPYVGYRDHDDHDEEVTADPDWAGTEAPPETYDSPIYDGPSGYEPYSGDGDSGGGDSGGGGGE